MLGPIQDPFLLPSPSAAAGGGSCLCDIYRWAAGSAGRPHPCLLVRAKVIILADGIGQFEGSGLISARAVLTAIEYLDYLTSQGGQIDESALRQTMAMASSAAISLNGELAAQRSSGGGTTLLIGIETADYFYVGAAGDGAVVFINGQSKTVRNALISEPGRRIRGYIGAPGALPTILSYPKLNPDGHALFLPQTEWPPR